MTLNGDGVVVVGGGLAGQRCVETLRRSGYDGQIRFVCGEDRRPYDRPPLSKEILAGVREAESLPYRSAGWYAEHEIDLLLGTHALELEAQTRRLRLSGGETLRYSRLLIATGSRPRTLPLLTGYENVWTLRSLEDARGLGACLADQPRVAVVGAGFIGQEVAATARRLGCQVTLIEAAACPLAAVLGPVLGEWFAWLHRSEGVDVHTGCTVERVLGGNTVRRLRLSDGTILDVDLVVVGVGVAPELDWLASSGLCSDGQLAVGPHGQTSAPDVMAAGDVAATFSPHAGCHVPGSHWEAAARQGAAAARVMLGLDPGRSSLSTFWTDQYGVRVQYVGHARPGDQLEIDGRLEERNFTASFIRNGRPTAALVADRTRALPALRAQIEKGTQ